MDEFNTPERLALPWEQYFTKSIAAVYKQETREQIDRELDLGLALFPELMAIEQAHREKMAHRLAHTLRQLGSSWSTRRLKRLGLFLYEISTATWRYRSQHADGDELLDWETAAMLATVGRCMND